jgi:chitinase
MKYIYINIIMLSLILKIMSFESLAQHAPEPVRVAVITEGHSFDRDAFTQMFDSLEHITWKEHKNPDAQKLFKPENARNYDVLVFYDTWNEITDDIKKEYLDLVKGGKPVLFLHHGICSYPEWPEFSKMAGSKYLFKNETIEEIEYKTSTYHEDVEIPVQVADKNHFITQGISDFVIHDEVYGGLWHSDGVHSLLETKRTDSSPKLLYTHLYEGTRIVTMIPGHGAGAMGNPNYRKILGRSLLWLAGKENLSSDYSGIVLAYVTSWSRIMPDPNMVTHINYAFGHVNKTFNGVRIDNPDRLRAIVELKKQKPSLKVMLSIGGWGSGNFSEMAASGENRTAFAADCLAIINTFGLDGIDLDWEYPTSKAANISASSDDTENFTLLMKEIRKAIGKDKLLTFASPAGAGYVDFKELEPIVDFVNVMTYDMGNPPKHHAALYRSEHVGWICAQEGIDKHIEAGIPAHKLTVGMPFYGRGTDEIGGYLAYGKILELDESYTRSWDAKAMVPYLTDKEGKLVCTYEDPSSISIKCDYIRKRGLLGAMYWEYGCDDEEGSLRRAVYQSLKGIKNK